MSEAGSVTVVWVPGLGLGAEVVRPAVACGGDRWRSEVVLLPGFGEPVPRGLDVSPAALGDRLAELLTARRLGPVVLVGHSSSCQVVAEAAVRAPQAVAGLVLLGPTTDPRAATWPRLALRWLRTAAHEPPRQAPLLARLYRRTGLRNMAAVMDAARRHDLRDPLRRLGVPVAVARGPGDRIAPADWVTDLAGRTRGEATTLPAGAHMAVLTHPAPVARLVTDLVRAAGEQPPP